MTTLSDRRRELFSKALHKASEAYAAPEGELARTLWRLYGVLVPEDVLTEQNQPPAAGGQRPERDRHLHGLKHLATEAAQSWALRLLGSLFGCQEAVDKGLVLAERYRELARLGLSMARHELAYNRAYAAVEGQACDELRELYAGYKAWPDADNLSAYLDSVGRYEALKVELLLEGPLQLALSLSPEGISAVVRLPLWTGGRDEPATGEVLSLVLALRANLEQACVTDEGLLACAAAVLRDARDGYLADYAERLERLRCLAATAEARGRFCLALETGGYRHG